MTELYDPGLQPERTVLAWHRTLLALAAASALALRATVDGLGVPAILLCVSGLGLSLMAHFAAARRYERSCRSLSASGSLLPSGLAAFLAFATALMIAILAVGYLLLTA